MLEKSRDKTAERHVLRQIIAGLPQGIMLVTPAGSILWANDSATAMHGCRTYEDLGTTAIEYGERFLLRDGKQHPLPARSYPVARMLAGETFSSEVVMVAPRDEKPNDAHRILEISALMVTDQSDEPELLVLIMDDITERVDAEERFERAFAANPAPAIILQLEDSRFIKVNDGFLEMTGYDRADIIGHPFREHDLLHGAEFRDLAIQAMENHDTIAQQDSVIRLKSGETKFVVIAGQPIELNAKHCMLFTFMDLDKRKKAESRLRSSEERFSKAFQLAPIPMLVCTRDGWKIMEVNDAFSGTTGFPHEVVVNRSAIDAGLLINADAIREISATLEVGDSVRSREITIRTLDGHEIDALLSAEAVSIQDEPCVLFVMQDITQRKRSEEDIVAAIESVMKDTSWFSHMLMEKLAQIRHPEKPSTELDMLTAREREVLELICKGMTDAEIAQSLNLSRNTVRNHVASLYSKIGVNRRSAAVVWGRERGLAHY